MEALGHLSATEKNHVNHPHPVVSGSQNPNVLIQRAKYGDEEYGPAGAHEAIFARVTYGYYGESGMI